MCAASKDSGTPKMLYDDPACISQPGISGLDLAFYDHLLIVVVISNSPPGNGRDATTVLFCGIINSPDFISLLDEVAGPVCPLPAIALPLRS